MILDVEAQFHQCTYDTKERYTKHISKFILIIKHGYTFPKSKQRSSQMNHLSEQMAVTKLIL